MNVYKSIVSAADSYVWLLERAFGEEYGLVMGVFLVCQSLGKKEHIDATLYVCCITCMLMISCYCHFTNCLVLVFRPVMNCLCSLMIRSHTLHGRIIGPKYNINPAPIFLLGNSVTLGEVSWSHYNWMQRITVQTVQSTACYCRHYTTSQRMRGAMTLVWLASSLSADQLTLIFACWIISSSG